MYVLTYSGSLVLEIGQSVTYISSFGVVVDTGQSKRVSLNNVKLSTAT